MPFLVTQIQLVYGALRSHLDLTPDYFQKGSVHIQKEALGGRVCSRCLPTKLFLPLYFLLTDFTQAWGDRGFKEQLSFIGLSSRSAGCEFQWICRLRVVSSKRIADHRICLKLQVSERVKIVSKEPVWPR